MPEIEDRRKKPLPVRMLLWDGTNLAQVDDFTGRGNCGGREGDELEVWNDQENNWMTVPLGHYVVKSTLGEYYPMSPDAYERTTEAAQDADRDAIRADAEAAARALDERRENAERALAAQADAFEKLTDASARVMYAALIDLVRGDAAAAKLLLAEQTGGHDGPVWDGAETGLQYIKRARSLPKAKPEPERM